MNNEIQKLQAEITDLKKKLDETDDFAGGVLKVLITILPFLIRDHPESLKIRDLLKSSSDCYEKLLSNSEKSTFDGVNTGVYEPSKMLYKNLALLGVWGEKDQKEVEASFERLLKKR